MQNHRRPTYQQAAPDTTRWWVEGNLLLRSQWLVFPTGGCVVWLDQDGRGQRHAQAVVLAYQQAGWVSVRCCRVEGG